jgi:hypothetical protein
MNYYLKYIKYKNKYLLLKGGKIPEIEKHGEELIKKYLPFNYSNYKLTLNNKVIKDGETPIYNLNSNFEYEENETAILPDIVKNYYLFYNDKIKIHDIEIPFDTLFLNNSFNIIFTLYVLLTNYEYTDIIFKNCVQIIKDEDISLIQSIDNIIRDNNCTEDIYIKKIACINFKQEDTEDNYNLFKKQIEDNISYLKKLNLKESLDDNHNQVLQLKSEISAKEFKKLILSNNIIQLQNEINDDDDDDVKEIKNNNIINEKKKIIELDKQINSINCKNKLIMKIDKSISDIIKFKNIVNDTVIYDNIVINKVAQQNKKIQSIYNKYFNIDSNNRICIGISVKPNILNKYIFINKFRELLLILYSNSKTEDEIKNQLDCLYDNRDAFINICDMMQLYEKAINSNQSITTEQIKKYSENINNQTNKEAEKNTIYNKYIKNEIKLIMELKEFIKYCDIVDNINNLNDFLKIKTSIIFFASFIGDHFNKITFPKLDNYLFPTNIDNIICNLLNINNDELYDKYAQANNTEIENKIVIDEEISKKLYIKNEIIAINKQIFELTGPSESNLKLLEIYKKKIIELENEIKEVDKNINLKYTKYNLFYISNLPKIFRYGNATFENNQFPDCVENTLLHFVRAIIWDPTTQKYNTEFLPDSSIQELKDFVELLKTGNENTQEIKNKFNEIIQDRDQNNELFNNVYKKTNNGVNYEIKSNIINFKTFLNYLFGITDCIQYKYKNINIKEIKEDDSKIYIEYNDLPYMYVFNINIGHSSVSKNITNYIILTNIVHSLTNYTYINLIYLLSSDYNNHKITNFNIYDKYIKEYCDSKEKLPFYLIFLMQDENIYNRAPIVELHYVDNIAYLSNYETEIKNTQYRYIEHILHIF